MQKKSYHNTQWISNFKCKILIILYMKNKRNLKHFPYFCCVPGYITPLCIKDIYSY